MKSQHVRDDHESWNVEENILDWRLRKFLVVKLAESDCFNIQGEQKIEKVLGKDIMILILYHM